MAWRKACISVLILCTVLPSLGQSSPDGALTAAEYGERLDQLISSTSQPLTSQQTVDILRDLPASWRVNANDRQFEISTQWLHEDLLKYGDKADAKLLESDHAKLVALRADLNGYVDTSSDNSAARVRLGKILARREFEDAQQGPGFIGRLKQRLLLYAIRLLSRIFGSSSIPEIGRFLVYGLAGLAILGLAYWIYRTLRADTRLEHIVPPSMAVSAKEWTLWMAEARAAADQGNWRDAIHLAYWAGISFLESQGAWRPDRARTPREYLRLMPKSSERHSTLTALTRSFEVVWYGNREADSQAFSQTLEELGKLGCRQN